MDIWKYTDIHSHAEIHTHTYILPYILTYSNNEYFSKIYSHCAFCIVRIHVITM